MLSSVTANLMMDERDEEIATVIQGDGSFAKRGETPLAQRFRISVAEGVATDRGKSAILDALQPTPLLVGQSPVCDLRLTDREVSRRHLSLEAVGDGSGIRVVDLGSTNGTFVDRVRVHDATLTGGEVLRLGSTMLAIDVAEVESAAAKRTSPAPRKAAAFGRVLGQSREMQRLYPLCERLAATDVPVIIEGETGTGKEVLAESLHEQSPRARTGSFVVFDCTTAPPSLVESELFGHERGSFTGAVSTRKGVFEQAHGGTLLIDEIGDLDLALQPKLLRALERSEIRRVGGDRWIKVDVRILAATRRNLDVEVAEGRFRDDLFHRLAVARIALPPLRARGSGDIELLARSIWKSLGGAPGAILDHAIKKWSLDPWPGNVRALRNAVARTLALGDLDPQSATNADAAADDGSIPIDVEDVKGDDLVERLLKENHPFFTARELLLAEFEQRYIERVLAAHGGDVAKAASAAKIGRRYFYVLKGRRR